MVFNATFNNILTISCRSVLFVEETGVPGENHPSPITITRCRLFIVCYILFSNVMQETVIRIIIMKDIFCFLIWIYITIRRYELRLLFSNSLLSASFANLYRYIGACVLLF
jgi:hypothetical protein